MKTLKIGHPVQVASVICDILAPTVKENNGYLVQAYLLLANVIIVNALSVQCQHLLQKLLQTPLSQKREPTYLRVVIIFSRCRVPRATNRCKLGRPLHKSHNFKMSIKTVKGYSACSLVKFSKLS